MKKNVVYIAHGNYNILSRAKKQINSLLKNDYAVTLLNGYFNIEPTYDYNFKIIKKCIKEKKSSLSNLYHLLKFNFTIYKEINFNIDVVICRELSVLLAGVIIKQHCKCKLVYDSNELSVETHTGIKKTIWRMIERYSIKYCDLIIHAEEHRLALFKKTYSISDNYTSMIVLQNYHYFNNITSQKNTKKIQVLYFGAIGPQRDIEEMIDAFKELKDFQLDLLGFCSESYSIKLQSFFNDKNVTNVNILKQINDEDIDKVFNNYNIGFAFYPNTNLNNFYCAPNKVYQYIQNDMAVITTNNPPLVEFVEKHNIGVCIDIVDAKNIKMAIQKITDDYLQRNINLELKKQYSWEAIEGKFINSINKL